MSVGSTSTRRIEALVAITTLAALRLAICADRPATQAVVARAASTVAPRAAITHDARPAPHIVVSAHDRGQVALFDANGRADRAAGHRSLATTSARACPRLTPATLHMIALEARSPAWTELPIGFASRAPPRA